MGLVWVQFEMTGGYRHKNTAHGAAGGTVLPWGNAVHHRRMHPPFSFPAGKENGPCTVQKKRAFGVQLYPKGAKLDGRGLVVRCATRSGNLLPGALYRVRG